MHYVGAVLVFRGKSSLPHGILKLLTKWKTMDTEPGERTAAQRIECGKRERVLDKMRKAAAELGINHQDHEATPEGRIVMNLQLVNFIVIVAILVEFVIPVGGGLSLIGRSSALPSDWTGEPSVHSTYLLTQITT
ncbi:hypothetical protein FAUST_7819 [Fusarium austroamericanum]|uniref:Uncharacterized protein n=1 Tax=Fusarium austroamericanum TaxID=282268 RepID=A0AAN6BY49_FUSAU|nr:hypothetical protein FAUST_7819 [Fusarium austroamericanum]